MIDITKQLASAGLTDNEIKVYLYLLEQGISSPPQTAKGTGISRPNLYGLLRSLKEKGLVAEQKKGTRNTYLATDPSSLVHRLEARAEAMKQLLPDLRALYVAKVNKPSIKFFEGPEQVKEIFYEMLEAKQVYGVASTKKLYDALGWDFFDGYIKQMRKKGIFLKDILTQDSINTSAKTPIGILSAMYDTRLFPKSVDALPVDILIWDDKVALISTEAPVFGTLIKNAAIAKVMRLMFEHTWSDLS